MFRFIIFFIVFASSLAYSQIDVPDSLLGNKKSIEADLSDVDCPPGSLTRDYGRKWNGLFILVTWDKDNVDHYITQTIEVYGKYLSDQKEGECTERWTYQKVSWSPKLKRKIIDEIRKNKRWKGHIINFP